MRSIEPEINQGSSCWNNAIRPLNLRSTVFLGMLFAATQSSCAVETEGDLDRIVGSIVGHVQSPVDLLDG